MTTKPANRDLAPTPAAPAVPAAVEQPVRKKLSQEDRENLNLMRPYIEATRANPYHPESWLDTAEAFLGKYNELACADALKAHILCDEYVRELLPKDAKVPKLNKRELDAYRDNACWVLYMALKELGASDEASEYYDQIPPVLLLPRRVPKSIDMQGWKKKTEPLLARHDYPFMFGRQPKAIDAAQKKFDDAYMKNAMRIDKASFAADANVYGIFATRNIDKGATLLQNNIVKADLPSVRDDLQKPAMVLFEHVVRDSIANLDKPPQESTLAKLGNSSLTVHYGGEPDDFSFHHLIKRIAMILLREKRLFDPKFDFYKWFTVYWKLCTNSFTHQFMQENGELRKEVVGVAPLYSFFNHSCDPNAKWSPTEDADTDKMFMRVSTIQKIEANKEIFIPYITDEELAKPVSERRAILKDWFGGDCMCTKCVAEVEAQEEKSRKADAIAKAKAIPLGATSRLEGVSAKKKRKDDDDDSRPGSKRTRTEPHIQYSYAGS